MGCLTDCISSVFKLDYRSIVTCGYEVGFKNIGMIKKPLPFNLPITYDTRIRSPAAKVVLHERLHHLALKIRHAVKGVIGNPDCVRGPPGIIDLTAAAFLPLCACPRSQRNAHNIISGLFEKIGSHGAVNASRHSDNYFFHEKVFPF